MRRRDFITGIGGSAAVWPLTARAQQPPVIGFLNNASPIPFAEHLAAFHSGLKETGYVEGQNVAVEYRWAEGNYDRLPALINDFVRRRVSVITTTGGIPDARAAKAATANIPVVFYTGVDPVKFGLVASLNRPGSNLTGVTSLSLEVGAKRLELLHQVVPAVETVGLLVNPTSPSFAEAATRDAQQAARALGLQLRILHASSGAEIDKVFASLSEQRVQALAIGGDNFFNSRSDQLAMLALQHNVPAIYQYRAFAAAGGLMSYGANITEGYRQVGVYTGRVLKGEKPADLPVIQSTRVELIINLKTANAFGLTMPLALLGRADEVIE